MAKKNELDIDKALSNHFEESKIYEFPFFNYARQGGRTAVEILARAFVMQGKQVYIGARLYGARSGGANNIVLRFADTNDIPTGISTTHPRGFMLMHEDLVWPIPTMERDRTKNETIRKASKGLLMVSTHKAPEEVEYPLDFEGTVATVDAESIFLDIVHKEPAASGIACLGLFVAATGNLISLDSVREAILQHERLSKKVLELNAQCMQVAYENTRVAHNIKIKGRYTPEEFEERTKEMATTDYLTEEDMTARIWTDQLPVFNTKKCICIDCLAAYYCGPGVLRWKDEALDMQYGFCKGCGTCAEECPEKAVTMESAMKVMASLKR